MRQFIVEKGKERNGLIQLDGKDYRYLRQVLRVRVGDMINVRLSDGSLNNATVVMVDESSRLISLQICADTKACCGQEKKTITRGVQASELVAGGDGGRGLGNDGWKGDVNGGAKGLVNGGANGGAKGLVNGGANGGAKGLVNGAALIEYWLFQFLPRPQKFELIVRQATECGVAVIVPVVGDFSEKSSAQALLGAKKDRLDRIIKEARQQSGSPVDTKVIEPLSLENALELWKKTCESEKEQQGDSLDAHSRNKSVAFVLSERGDCDGNLRAVVEDAGGFNCIKRAAIAVGSEGGISPGEVKFLEEKGLFQPIHFAVNILRCETAALYGIAAVQSEINQSSL